MNVKLRQKFVRIIQASRIKVNFTRVAVGVISHLRATTRAEEAACAGRRFIDIRRDAGETVGSARHAKKRHNRRRVRAPATLAVAVPGSIFRPAIFIGHATAQTTPAILSHSSSPLRAISILPINTAYAARPCCILSDRADKKAILGDAI